MGQYPVILYVELKQSYIFRNTFLVDPTFQEERVMNGRLIFGLNIHKEICALQMIGGVSISPDEVSGSYLSWWEVLSLAEPLPLAWLCQTCTMC